MLCPLVNRISGGYYELYNNGELVHTSTADYRYGERFTFGSCPSSSPSMSPAPSMTPAPSCTSTTVELQVQADDFGYEIGFEITDSSGTVVLSRDYGFFPSYELTKISADLCADCFSFEIYDWYCDG